MSGPLSELGERIRTINEKNGWITPEDDTLDHQIAVLALVISEVVEAIEELRNGHAVTETYYSGSNVSPFDPSSPTNPDGSMRKPEGVPTELADALIRLLDFFDARGIDPDLAVEGKLLYNETRGYRHGGKTI